MKCPHQNLPIRAKGVMWKRMQKGQERKRDRDSKKTVSSRHKRSDTYMISQGLWQQVQGMQLQAIKPDGVPALRGDVDIDGHS